MSSALEGVIAKLHRGERLSEEAVNEIQRLLDGLRGEGWSGFIPADGALKVLCADVGRSRAALREIAALTVPKRIGEGAVELPSFTRIGEIANNALAANDEPDRSAL